LGDGFLRLNDKYSIFIFRKSVLQKMNILLFCKIAQIIMSALIIILVLVQSKTAGLSPGLKSSFNRYRSLRGVEKGIFGLTVVLGVLLVVNSLAIVLLS